jgi:hypothetical protein
MDKGMSRSKLKLTVAALNFKYNTVENRLKIVTPKYYKIGNAKPHIAYS